MASPLSLTLICLFGSTGAAISAPSSSTRTTATSLIQLGQQSSKRTGLGFQTQRLRRSLKQMAENEAADSGKADPQMSVESPSGGVGGGAINAGASPPKMSQAVPFLERPKTLDVMELSGDYGFDPLGLAKDKETLIQYRLAEIKHARLAMLAAVAWPIQELENPVLAKLLNLPNLVEETGGRSPSVLNGGLEQVSAAYWTAIMLLAIVIENIGNDRWGGTVQPGDFGFDPLNLMPKDKVGANAMRERELTNGRLAMVAILGFVVQEFIKQSAVVDQTPFFFKPILG